jgi:uncharacterized protein YjiK
MKDTVLRSSFMIVILLITLLFVSWINIKPASTGKLREYIVRKDTIIRILNKWKMPPVLKEISGISWLDNDHFACVQDNVGKIFIFNIRKNGIEKEIPVVPLNDFEGIAIVGTTAYLLRADGTLWEVQSYRDRQPIVKQYHTFFNQKNNMEGLCYDRVNKRLLLVVKTRDPFRKDQKGIYSFDLESKKLDSTSIYKIDLNDPRWGHKSNKRKVRPSDLAINPVTGEIYVLDGEAPKLVILTENGDIRSIYKLNEKDFPLPEGISFAENGRLFISNEGRWAKGNILEVCIND